MAEILFATDPNPRQQLQLVPARVRFRRNGPMLIAARSMLLRHSRSFVAGLSFMVLAGIAGGAHILAAEHNFAASSDGWGRAAYWGAYVAAWLAFLIGSTRSIAFGLLLLTGYAVAGRFGLADAGQLETTLLLAVVAIAVRVLFFILRNTAKGFEAP